MILDTLWSTIALACIAALGTFLLSVAFLVDWLRNWQHVKGYWAYGLGAGLIVLGFDVLGVLATPLLWGEMISSAVVMITIMIGLAVDAILATRIAGFAMLGMHYAAVIGCPSLPFLSLGLPVRRAPAGGALVAPEGLAPASAAGTALGSGVGAATATLRAGLPPAEGESPEIVPAAAGGAAAQAREGDGPLTRGAAGTCAAPGPSLRNAALSALAVVAFSVAYSIVLFTLTSPTQSRIIRWVSQFAPASALTVDLRVFILVLAAAFGEEVVFRLGIQNFLARYLRLLGGKYWLAIILTSALWTLGHVGTIEPGWVKAAQIFPMGLLLGWLYRRYGVEACIVAHGLFNVILLPLSSSLIR